jgi:hypothetical protein
MLIPFRQLLFKFKRIPKGIIHVGAHIGEEAFQYEECGIDNVIWIEGNPEVFKVLCENISKYTNNYAFNCIISDKDNVAFNVFCACSLTQALFSLSFKNRKATKFLTVLIKSSSFSFE